MHLQKKIAIYKGQSLVPKGAKGPKQVAPGAEAYLTLWLKPKKLKS